MTRLAELACQLAESLSNRLTWIPSLLVELGVDSTSSPSKLMFKSFILLAELYEQLAESIFIRRTLMLRLAELYEQLAESVLDLRRLP